MKNKWKIINKIKNLDENLIKTINIKDFAPDPTKRKTKKTKFLNYNYRKILIIMKFKTKPDIPHNHPKVQNPHQFQVKIPKWIILNTKLIKKSEKIIS